MAQKPPLPDKTLLLAADMGATHSRFCIFSVTESPNRSPRLEIVRFRELLAADHGDFSDLLHHLKESGLFQDIVVRHAAMATPGPVVSGRCIPPNLPWTIEAKTAEKVLGLDRCLLLNDFVAQGYAALMAEDAHGREMLGLEPLKPGIRESDFPAAIMGAGTGLGQAVVLPDQSLVLASECGHGYFSFVDADERKFCAYLQAVRGQADISADIVLGGSGFADFYNFIMKTDVGPAEATARIRKAPEQPGHDRVMGGYARFYGRAAQNFALASLCRRGLYIAGGMALRVPVLKHPEFIAEFERNTAQGALLKAMPVFHLTHPHSGLWGAGVYGATRLPCPPPPVGGVQADQNDLRYAP